MTPAPGLRQRVAAPPLDHSLQLHDGQYLKSRRTKTLIVLHHTAGGSAQSTFTWWNTGDPRRIGTAYLIARDGTIHQTFDDGFWAWHLGVKDDAIEKRSIGIELCSWGGLTLTNGVLYAWDGKKRVGTLEEWHVANRLHEELQGYRGYRYFERYTQAQIDATCALVPWLCQRYGIRPRITQPFFGDASLSTHYEFEGVVHHALLRRDKSDLHPGFPHGLLSDALRAVPRGSR